MLRIRKKAASLKMTPITLRKTLAVLALALCGGIGTSIRGAAQEADPLAALSPTQKAQTLDTYHQIGLNGDKSQIAPLIQALKPKSFSGYSIILLTLARLGATEAIPALDALVPSNPVNYTAGDKLIRITRARILAETEVTPHAQAARFFQEIGETPEQVTSVMQKYINDERAHSPKIVDPFQEELAEEQLADMIYHGSAQELLADPLISQINFNLWPPARIKIEMAQLSHDQQRQTLVDRLANAKIYTGDDTSEGQILIDLGHEQAVQAVSAKLQVMDADSKSYAPDGFNALFTVLYACQDTDQAAAVLAHYQKDADVKISGQANRVASGFGIAKPGLIVFGY